VRESIQIILQHNITQKNPPTKSASKAEKNEMKREVGIKQSNIRTAKIKLNTEAMKNAAKEKNLKMRRKKHSQTPTKGNMQQQRLQ
jgi:hypothetical protein